MDHQEREVLRNNDKGSSSRKNSDQMEKDADDAKKRSSGMVKRLVTEDVDKLADDFISKFRNQLKIERQDSLKRYREMIARGV